ncbi:hypothetical protein BJX62DRAFT_228560 [Aspergillus germanicus]
MPTPSACAGKTYTVEPGDTCQSICQSQGIETAWLLYDSWLESWCNNFPTAGTTCLVNTCTPYTLQADDTCLSLSRLHKISQIQLVTWNPILGNSCRNIERSIGDTICVSPQAMKTGHHRPLIPDNIAAGRNELCAQFYEFIPGDYCNKVIIKYSLSLEDFLFLNAGVNQNCTNLFAEESYCVQPVGSIDQYSGHPGYIPPAPSVSEIPFSDQPNATYTPPALNQTSPLPFANGTRGDCYIYVDGAELQVDIAGTFYASTCDALVHTWGISAEQLENCSIPSTTSGTATTTTTTSGDAAPGPTQSGIPSNCNKWHLVEEGDTCYDIAQDNNITLEQFYGWNPAVKSDCGEGFWLGNAYCVGVA